MNKNIKGFIFKFIILSCTIIAADFAAGVILKIIFYKQRSGKYFTTSHALRVGKEQVMIFGNSHAAQHFDAPLMKKMLGKTVFNFGNQGQSLFYTYPLIKSVLARHKPGLIILNLDYTELRYDAADYERLSIFLPYYHINTIVDSAIAMSGKNEELKAHSALYRYNSTLGYIFLNTFGHAYNKSEQSLGYDPTEGDICASGIIDDLDKSVNRKAGTDTLKIDCLVKIIKNIQAAHVKLLVTTTPLFEYDDTEAHIYKQKLSSVLRALNVDYLDYGTSADFMGKCKYFHDVSHLNPAGADKWTGECTRYIKENIFK